MAEIGIFGAGLSEDVRTLPCPACREIVREDAAVCRFCDAPLDASSAAAAAELQSKVNRACSDASYLRIAAGAMWVAYASALLPVPYWLNSMFLALFAVVPVMLVRWQSRFGRLVIEDADYTRARRAKNVALLMWLAVIPVAFLIEPALDNSSFPD